MPNIDTPWLQSLKPGDMVMRMLAGVVPMRFKVTLTDDYHIYCGPWKFLKATGYEVDEELGWDGVTLTGSYLTPEN